MDKQTNTEIVFKILSDGHIFLSKPLNNKMKVTNLMIGGIDFTNTDRLKTFCLDLSAFQFLTGFTLANVQWSDESISNFGEWLASSNITDLAFSNMRISYRGHVLFFQALQRNTHLKSLSLHNVVLNNQLKNEIEREGFTELFNWLKTNHTLESLYLTEMFFPISIVEPMKTCLTQNKHLKKLWIHQEYPLILSAQGIFKYENAPVLETICELFKTNTTITDLACTIGAIEKKEYPTFKEMIQQNRSLKKLKITQSNHYYHVFPEDLSLHLKEQNFSLHTFKFGESPSSLLHSQLLSFGKRNQKLDIYKLSEAISKTTPLFPPLASIVISYYLEPDNEPEYNLDSEVRENLIKFAYNKHQQQEDTLELDSAQNKELIEWIETQSEPKRGYKNG